MEVKMNPNLQDKSISSHPKNKDIYTKDYNKCKDQQDLPKEDMLNHVKKIYSEVTAEEISKKIGDLVTVEGVKSEIKIIYQSIENLHSACTNHLGDWYFTGDYPTPGGNRVVNRAFINFYEGKSLGFFAKKFRGRSTTFTKYSIISSVYMLDFATS